jgi:hypothetical protein
MPILPSDNNCCIAEHDEVLLLHFDQFVSHLFGTGLGVESEDDQIGHFVSTSFFSNSCF